MSSKISLSRISKGNLLEALNWREESLESLRTSDFIIDIKQEGFYDSLKTRSDIQFYSIFKEVFLIGVGGFVNVNQVNRNAEISIILNPKYRNSGNGKKAVESLIRHGFRINNFKNIYGEVYFCNPYKKFWDNIISKKLAYSTILPERKYFDGKYHDGLYFNFNYESDFRL